MRLQCVSILIIFNFNVFVVRSHTPRRWYFVQTHTKNKSSLMICVFFFYLRKITLSARRPKPMLVIDQVYVWF